MKYEGPWMYVKSHRNWLDWLMIILYIEYFIIRIYNRNTNIIPQLPDNLKGDELKAFLDSERVNYLKMTAPMIHTMLTFLAFFKFLRLSICYLPFGNLALIVA